LPLSPVKKQSADSSPAQRRLSFSQLDTGENCQIASVAGHGAGKPSFRWPTPRPEAGPGAWCSRPSPSLYSG
jgi:hypothetical protein